MKTAIVTLLALVAAATARTQDGERLKPDTLTAAVADVAYPVGDAVTGIPSKLADTLVTHARQTAENTAPEIFIGRKWDYISLWIFALVSAFFAVWSTRLSWLSNKNTKETADNVSEQTKQQEINLLMQENLLKDLVRHIYRNKVVVCAMRWKLREAGMDGHYPSEEHLLKLKVLPEDLRLDRFDTSPMHYDELHRVELLFRNYNIEVDVALEHLKTKGMPEDVKTSDFDTLEFKSQHLTITIRDLMIKLRLLTPADGDKDGNGYIGGYLLEKHLQEKQKREERERERSERERANTPEKRPGDVPERKNDRDAYYDKIGLKDPLDLDIAHEYGIIKLIAFPA